MNKLWIFGDSFSSSCGLIDDNPYEAWLTKNTVSSSPLECSWQYLLAKDLDLELKERAKTGCGNTEIITEVLANINYIDKNDFIIIGWTIPTRLSLPGDIENFITIPNYIQAKNLDNKFGGTHYYDFYTNTFPDKINHHVKYWNNIGMELSQHLSRSYNIITWSWSHILSNIDSISDHTNNIIRDEHPSIHGHRYIADMLKNMKWGTLFDLNIEAETIEHIHKPQNLK